MVSPGTATFLVANSQQYKDLLFTSLQLLRESGTRLELDRHAGEILQRRNEASVILEDSRKYGGEVKSGNLEQPQTPHFLKFLSHGLRRPLLQHQVKAALHLVNVAHGANFSVPGAGKTSVVLAVYEYLRLKGSVNMLFCCRTQVLLHALAIRI